MRITVNASQLRSLASQTGQGWLMTLRQGTLTLQSHVLDRGYETVVERPITADEARALARELLDDEVYELPSNVNTEGHTQLTVGVLNHRDRRHGPRIRLTQGRRRREGRDRRSAQSARPFSSFMRAP